MEERRDDPVAFVQRPVLGGQERAAEGAPCPGVVDRAAEPGGQRPLLGLRQRVDPLDRNAAQVEEAQDRAPRLRDGEGGCERDDRERDRDDERTTTRPGAELEPGGDVRGRRPCHRGLQRP